MTSSQSAVSYSDQQLSKSYQQMSREGQEMKRRRRRRFQSQVTVDEAVVSYYSRSCRQFPFILLLTNLAKDSADALCVDNQQRLRQHICWRKVKSATLTSAYPLEETEISNADISIYVEEAGGSNRDVIINITRAVGRNHHLKGKESVAKMESYIFLISGNKICTILGISTIYRGALHGNGKKTTN
ncbi:hypothetical protein F511_42269 [Dorcoceras hygrometricum]|uniref:Uncharacterized protein n=1 Tax=Dorcoceras hygrometricum TaxID=472368 RepID=A0A2Z7DBJ1_9LAMI|nr:hypothetical protein F511_42269 [Dorcoceras hygrometricum]